MSFKVGCFPKVPTVGPFLWVYQIGLSMGIDKSHGGDQVWEQPKCFSVGGGLESAGGFKQRWIMSTACDQWCPSLECSLSLGSLSHHVVICCAAQDLNSLPIFWFLQFLQDLYPTGLYREVYLFFLKGFK